MEFLMSEIVNTLSSLSFIFFFSRIFGEISSKIGQSVVIGELLCGIILGNSFFNVIHKSTVLTNMSEIGIIILLFKAGLETNIKEFLKSSGWATLVAFVGVAIPYILGYLTFLYFGFSKLESIFAGAVFVSTSVGITARVFIDLNSIQTKEAKIVLGASVIDDVIGLIILGIVLKFTSKNIVTFKSIFFMCGNSLLFLIITIFFGIKIIPLILNVLSKIKRSYTMLIAGIIFCFIISIASIKIGLASIIGAFVAGLIISTTRQSYEIKKDIRPIYNFFVPIFFVLIGTNVDLNVFNPFIKLNNSNLILTFVLFLVAVFGKVISGFFVFKKNINKLLIGISMIPRGEVGLIFADIGLKNNIFHVKNYTSIIFVIILTTFISPILLKYVLSKNKK
jgi:Kef-type K+ transport system membrane component KefB